MSTTLIARRALRWGAAATLTASAAGVTLLAGPSASAASAAAPTAHPAGVHRTGLVHVAPRITALPHLTPSPGASPDVAGHRHLNATSTNWSGYAATSGGYGTTSTSWVEPGVSCSAGEDSASSFWIGLDGDGSNTVEQTGTDADCSGGSPQYYAWYEFFDGADPAGTPSYSYPDEVEPGDSFTATSTANGGGSYTETLTDNSRGWTETKTGTDEGSQVSAEVIAEAPSTISGGQLERIPLSDFGSVSFGGSSVDGGSLAADPNLTDITMTGDSGGADATPSGINGSGGFSVTFNNSN